MNKSTQSGIVTGLMFCVLLVPSLVYSGQGWYQSLVALKWLVTLVPLGVGVVLSVFHTLKNYEASLWRLDQWSLWGFFWLIWSLGQPLWIHISSIQSWLREQVTFIAFWAALWTMRRGLPRASIPLLLNLSGWAGGLSALAAEVQLHQWYPRLLGFPLVMKVTEGYVGNVGQQNLLAFWLALTLLCSTAFIALPWKGRGAPNHFSRFLQFIPFAIISWALWGTTSRSGLGAFLLGLVTLMALATQGRRPRRSLLLLVVMPLFFGAIGLSRLEEDPQRGEAVTAKVNHMVSQWHTLGSRLGIWRSSIMVLARAPVTGVGLGQFKWHYLEGQRDAMERWSDQSWQYTQWAHNEVLQWACEFGLTGLVVLLVMVFLWLSRFRSRFRSGIPPEGCWAVALLILFVFACLWTRPLRRPEYVVWLACALAVANRWLFATIRGTRHRKMMSLFFALVALVALGYGAMTVKVDRGLARALKLPDGETQVAALEVLKGQFVVNDWAGRELARARLRLGEQRMDTSMVAQGLNELQEAFLKTPTSSDLRLLRWYGLKHGLKELLKKLEPFGIPPE